MRAAEWQGWLVLGSVVAGFALVTWWLYFSPLSARFSAIERRVGA
jgi:hypothetical protein